MNLRRFRFGALTLATLCLVPVLSQAATKHHHAAVAETASATTAATPKGEWKVGLVKDDKGGFGYCLARAEYNNGLTLAIALSPKQEINLGVGVPGAAYTKDDKYPMTVSIDGKLNRERVSAPVQTDLLLTPLGADPEVFALLKGGKVLSMKGPEDTALFALKGTGKALASLQACISSGMGKAPAEASAGAAPTGKAASKNAKGEKVKFPPSLYGLLQAAGLKNVEVIPVEDPAKAPVDFAWKTGNVMGGLRERPVPKDMTIEKMTDIISSSYKAQCKGTFDTKLGDVEDLPGVKLRTADIGCTMNGKTLDVSLLLYLTDTQLFSMFMHEAPEAEKADAMAARDKIAVKIRELAKQQNGKTAAPAPSSAPAAEAPAAAPAPTSAPATPTVIPGAAAASPPVSEAPADATAPSVLPPVAK